MEVTLPFGRAKARAARRASAEGHTVLDTRRLQRLLQLPGEPIGEVSARRSRYRREGDHLSAGSLMAKVSFHLPADSYFHRA